MSLLVVGVDPRIITTDLDRFPERDDSYVFEHLAYYCRHLETLPAIRIVVGSEGAIVTARHKYLRIARLLGLRFLRAVIDRRASNPDDLSAFLSRPDVHLLDWNTLDVEERATVVARQWQVFFFSRKLSESEKEDFSRLVDVFFDNLNQSRSPTVDQGKAVTDLTYDDARKSVEFQARLPIGDETWFAQYRELIADFGITHQVVIVSYQGGKFQLGT